MTKSHRCIIILISTTDDYIGDVGRDLELQELANGVIDTMTPHDSLRNRSETVVHENNVRGLLIVEVQEKTHRAWKKNCLVLSDLPVVALNDPIPIPPALGPPGTTGGRGGHTWQVHCEFVESF